MVLKSFACVSRCFEIVLSIFINNYLFPLFFAVLYFSGHS